MRIAVIGSRTINEYETLQNMLTGVTCTEVISGGATGTDYLAERWAKENGKRLRVMKPDYARYGKKAPILRNMQIVDAAQIVYVLWDGQSTGTRQAMDYAKKQGKPVICTIININEQLSIF